jgi:SNF2 family DNA or RNA helicase
MIKRSAGSHHYNQILSYRNLDELTKSIQPFSYRVRKEDCLDLPEKNYIKRTIQLTPEQKTVYDDLKKTAVSILNEQDQVTATTQLTCLLRLHQVSCGFVNTDEGEVLELKNSRLEELVSILDEVDGKVLIWATYRHDIKAIENKIKVLYGEDSVVSYYGDTKGEVRQELVNKFQNDPECKYFVGHPKTGGYGLTLVAANTVIYYSNNYDLEVRLQSEDRAHRIGQKNTVTYIDIVTEKTIDELIVKALRNKIDIATQVLGENFKKWLI